MAWADPFGRQITYVRLSVTDKCNLRCFYCMPERHRAFIPPTTYLTFDEIERVMAAFASLWRLAHPAYRWRAHGAQRAR